VNRTYLKDYIDRGRGRLPRSRRQRRNRARSLLLDVLSREMFPHAGPDIPIAQQVTNEMGRRMAAPLVDAVLADPRLVVMLAEDARQRISSMR
jgi:hypothetical protein